MLVKILARYVAAPAAGVGMLASFGMFDMQETGGGRADISSAESAGAGILAALDGPLQVARRIAVAGGTQIGIDPADLPDFLNGGGVMTSGRQTGAGAIPVAARKTVSVPDAGASGGSGFSSGGAWKTSAPPATQAN